MTAVADLRLRQRPFVALATDFADGTASPRALLEDCLAAIAVHEPRVRAFVHLDAAAARAAADAATARWRNGRPLSPIDGMPVGVKDIIETADMPTGMGSPLFTGWRSGRDAAAVYALREAGGVVLGKTVTTEFAATEPGETRNPRDPERTPGGSSSGSAAAVAAGMVSGALGTQVVGSIVRPASYCGCIGFKPSVGGINRGGSHDNFSQSCTGVLAASLEDAWSLAREIAARCGGDPGYPGLAGPRDVPAPQAPAAVAVLRTAGWSVATPAAKEAFEAALARIAGAGITVASAASSSVLAAVEEALAGALALTRRINTWEGRWPLNTYAARDRHKLSRAMRTRLDAAEAMDLGDYRAVLADRARIRDLYARLADECAACVTLAAPSAAPRGLHSTGDPTFAAPASLLGTPAVSLPLLSDEGLPLGLQVIGFEQQDAALFATAQALSALVGGEAGTGE
jgi:Asp-tRNA(Asn)/Glu-tRNA(Gln) amidotransferase A subunit family amidase